MRDDADVQTTVGSIWEFFFMPETRGRTLEEIEEAFGGKRGGGGIMGLVEDKHAIEHVEEGTRKADLDKE